MDVAQPALLLVAGVGGGLAGSVAGLASLVSYPALLAAGLSPVTANVTNTIALCGSSVGSVSSSQPELTGQRQRVLGFGSLALVMGGVGAALLLLTPASSFELLVPVLIAVSSVVLTIRPRLQRLGTGHLPDRHPLVVGGIAGMSVYAGYFGAAAGVVLLAVLSSVMTDSHAHVNAMKNVLLGVANLTAAIGFAVFGPVDWVAALPLAAGFLVGGYLGPKVVRRVDGDRLRMMTAAAGLALAVVLALRTY